MDFPWNFQHFSNFVHSFTHTCETMVNFDLKWIFREIFSIFQILSIVLHTLVKLWSISILKDFAKTGRLESKLFRFRQNQPTGVKIIQISPKPADWSQKFWDFAKTGRLESKLFRFRQNRPTGVKILGFHQNSTQNLQKTCVFDSMYTQAKEKVTRVSFFEKKVTRVSFFWTKELRGWVFNPPFLPKKLRIQVTRDNAIAETMSDMFRSSLILPKSSRPVILTTKRKSSPASLAPWFKCNLPAAKRSSKVKISVGETFFFFELGSTKGCEFLLAFIPFRASFAEIYFLLSEKGLFFVL